MNTFLETAGSVAAAVRRIPANYFAEMSSQGHQRTTFRFALCIGDGIWIAPGSCGSMDPGRRIGPALVRRMLPLVTLLLWVCQAAAAPIAVRFVEGVTHGFLLLRTVDGRLIASGDLLQVPGAGLANRTHQPSMARVGGTTLRLHISKQRPIKADAWR